MDKTGILNILDSITSNYRNIDVKDLPTQGYFYPEDFELSIKKASYEDILEYNFNYVKDKNGVANFGSILYEAYKIVSKNTIFSKQYSFEDIKSNDVLYIFFEIVKYTMNKDIFVPYTEIYGIEREVVFNKENFNYFDYNTLGYDYNKQTREFMHEGYRFSIPSIGVQNCLVTYVYKKELAKENLKLNYDFLFFLGNKNYLTNSEIDNLIIIFNEDLDDKQLSIIRDIVSNLASAIPNTLKVDSNIVSIDLKIDFENLFF